MTKLLINSKWITAICFLLLVSCTNKSNTTPSTSTPEQTPTGGSSNTDTDSTISLLTDTGFGKGISLRGNNTASPNTSSRLTPFGGEIGSPVWDIAEWSSKFLISQSDLIIGTDGSRMYQNEGKIISFKKVDYTVDIRLGVIASSEYERPRKNGEPWPHLLLEQEFVSPVRLNRLKKFILHFEGKLNRGVLTTSPNLFNPDLHTAQFQLYLTIQDLNTLSPGYGDFLWFGVPFYDYRYRVIQPYANKDFNDGAGGGKFIYSVGSSLYGDKSFQDKERITIDVDLKPTMTDAFNTARQRGYLQNSLLDNMKIAGMNLGWEVPGMIDCDFEFKNFDLRYSLQ